MLDSVRVRLTLWYTALLAIFLVGLSLATFFIFWQSTVRRTDSDLADLSEGFLATLQAELGDHQGAGRLKFAAEAAIAEHRFRDHIYAVFSPSGELVASSNVQPVVDRSGAALPAEVLASSSFRKFTEHVRTAESADGSPRNDRFYQKVEGGKSGYRAFARRFNASGQVCTLVILQSLHPQQEMFEEITGTFAWVIPLSLLLASAGGYFLARKSLLPVVAMSDQAGRIGAANLHVRLSVQNEKDELGHLARSFNKLLDRLDESFERQKTFMADASHELRTPVAILRGEAEVALSQPEREPEAYRESLSVLHHESQRLTKIVEDLFTLTRADAGQYPLTRQEFYLDELVADCVHSARTLALAKQIALTVTSSEEMPISADEALLRRAILNLLDNAIKYTPQGGSIAVSCRHEDKGYAVSVSDTGPGIPDEQKERIFERFFRVDKARSRSETDGGGAGLGLSIARWIIEAHEGRLELTRSDPHGSTFTAYVPSSPGA